MNDGAPVLRKDWRASPGAPTLSSTAGDTALNEALDPIVPDEHEGGEIQQVS